MVQRDPVCSTTLHCKVDKRSASAFAILYTASTSEMYDRLGALEGLARDYIDICLRSPWD